MTYCFECHDIVYRLVKCTFLKKVSNNLLQQATNFLTDHKIKLVIACLIFVGTFGVNSSPPVYFYAPNSGKVEGAYCFRLVHPCVYASVKKFIKIQF